MVNQFDIMENMCKRIELPLNIMLNDYPNIENKISAWCDADVVHDMDDLISQGSVKIPILEELMM